MARDKRRAFLELNAYRAAFEDMDWKEEPAVVGMIARIDAALKFGPDARLQSLRDAYVAHLGRIRRAEAAKRAADALDLLLIRAQRDPELRSDATFRARVVHAAAGVFAKCEHTLRAAEALDQVRCWRRECARKE